MFHFNIQYAPLWTSDFGVDDCSWGRVGDFAIDSSEESGTESLLHHNYRQFGSVWELQNVNKNKIIHQSQSDNLFA